MMSDQELRKKIMRRVWGIYVMRQLTSPAVRVGVVVGALLVFISSVSVGNVIANALHISSIPALVNFFVVAAANTTLAVQLAVSIAFLFALWTAVDFVRRSQKISLAV